MGQEIQINLHMTIDDNGQMEYNTIREKGEYFQRDQFDVLSYVESNNEDGPIKNRITIQPERVNIKRSGHVQMNQQFRLHKKTENVFKHPYGTIRMETYTKSIVYKRLENKEDGSLIIEYSVKLNGQEAREHRLELYFEE
ncbi:DUF1934 domain-containing protein [Cerasibacillus terrae]|uniref:DUF1934 domain-containing protein n=1 Tax=Cerasibacillus terrae TaxID=2498845 RepID=A0A5C8NZY4_9BACI|nr:DUF1934 domain-containing protein [Cerasibacillus terrae]TXL66602.1 DUF1934 domain-containing protein [Cerasibacillus terrae]